MKKQSGFTLIELMVVMAIIAILATAGLTAYSNYMKKARDSARSQLATQIMTKVEDLTGEGAPPSVAELTAFLDEAGVVAYTLPKMNPLVAQISGAIDSILGTTFALQKLDPFRGDPLCIDPSGYAYLPCGFAYATFSDGSYLISYGIEHPDSANNMWFIWGLRDYGTNMQSLPGNVLRTAGNVIGTNQYIIEANIGTYVFDSGTAISTLAPGVVMTDGDIISDVSDFGPGS